MHIILRHLLFFVEQDVQKALEDLQPRVDALLSEAKSYRVEGEPEVSVDVQQVAKELTRKVSGAHTTVALRRKTLRSVDKKLFRYQHDFEAIQKWLEDAEKAMEREEDEDKMKVDETWLQMQFSHEIL